MFTLIGLFFLTLKIAILASIYASLTVLLFYMLSKATKQDWLDKLLGMKFLLWVSAGFLYSVILFIYAFSFWAYAGLGDYFCIPVGNGYKVNSIDACESSWFEPDGDDGEYPRQADIINFRIKDGIICAAFTGYNSTACQNCFIVFNTETEAIIEFSSDSAYSEFAKKNNLPQIAEFKNFGDNYHEYWSARNSIFLP